MKHALKALLSDLLPALVFLAVFALTQNVALTMAASISVGIIQIAHAVWRKEPVPGLRWLSMALVLIFGAAAIYAHDNRFILVKPTLINFAVGIFMLKRGWLDRYLPEIVHQNVPQSVIIASGYGWAMLQFAVGIGNFVVAMHSSVTVWAIYNSFASPISTMTGFLVQWLVFRTIITRKFRASHAA